MKQYTSIIIAGVLLILALFFFLFTLLNPKTIEKEIIKIEKQIEYRDTVIEKEVIKFVVWVPEDHVENIEKMIC